MYYVKELFIILIIIPLLTALIYITGTILAIKIFCGKIKKINIGSGKEIFKYKYFQINAQIYKNIHWEMSGISINNRTAKIFIHLSGGLANILLGFILTQSLEYGFIELSLSSFLFMIYNIYYGARNLIPFTSQDGINNDGMRIFHILMYGYSAHYNTYNSNMKEYSLTMNAKNIIEEGKYDEAIAMLNQITNIRLQFPLACFYRGIAYQKSGKHHEAIQDFKDYLQFAPNSKAAHVNLGNAYHILGDMENYYQYTHAAYKLDSKETSAINNLSNYYRIVGDYEKAIMYAEMGINIDPNKAILYLTLAETYLCLKSMDKFYTNIETALKKGYTIESLYKNKSLEGIMDDVHLQVIIGKYAEQKTLNKQ